MNKIIKAIHRIKRILIGKKGVYCNYGIGNKFCSNVFLHEMTTIGNYNYIGHNTMTLNCKIGNYCSIASNVKIGQMEHDLNCISTSTHVFPSIMNNRGIFEPTIIENDVWIAANCVIKQGVRIGTGAVVGAGAVVTKDVPSYAIVAGVPAKVIRYRFDNNAIDKLLESQWWVLDKKEALNKCKKLQQEIDKQK